MVAGKLLFAKFALDLDHQILKKELNFPFPSISTTPINAGTMVTFEQTATEKPMKIIQMSHISAESHGRASAVYADHSTSHTFHGGIHHHQHAGK
jgi:hypothetical protein